MERAHSERVAGRYTLVRQIGTGTMSTVYEAHDVRRTNRVVAVKLLNTGHTDELKHQLFRRETRALEQVEHPHIVRLFDQGWSEEFGCHYIVLEYLPRTLLDDINKLKLHKDLDRCWPLMRAMTDALVYAHSLGIIHRDLKPTNILMTEAGEPKISDFGISYLKFEMAVGMTVSSFWSVGYASPEQQQGLQATEKSDIYSLGRVFYHLLSGLAPPASGTISPEELSEVGLPLQVERILRKMLNTEPEYRFESAVQLRRQLDVTNRFTLLPELHLLLTDRARRDLFDMGYIVRSSAEEARTFLEDEFGGDDPLEVFFSLENTDVRIYTETLRLVCVRDASVPGLVIKSIHVPYQPHMERQRQAAMRARYLWQFDAPPIPYYQKLAHSLDALFESLATHNKTLQTKYTQRVERKDFTKAWDDVLSFQKAQMEAVPKLPYRRVTRDENILQFELRQPAPDDLAWPESSPMALSAVNKEKRPSRIGHLMSISGSSVSVAWDPTVLQDHPEWRGGLPATGILSVYHQEATAALDRQRFALNALLAGTTANPHLPDVLLDISTAAFDEVDTTLEFFQPGLADDKKNAVRQALATQDIFLLQGPPGTGKTTTLAEIIAQILKSKPDARILVSSQSNVAVNHILGRVAALREGQSTEIVRIGRADKIGQGAEAWTLEQRLDNWRSDVVAKTDTVLKELRDRSRKQQRFAHLKQEVSQKTRDALFHCQIALDAVGTDISSFTPPSATSASSQDQDDEKRASRFRDMAETLEIIRVELEDILPSDDLPAPSPDLEGEWFELSHFVTSLLETDPPQRREEELISLVKA